MKAAYVTGLEECSILDVDKPTIKPDEVLIKVKTVGICGSDLHVFTGKHAFRKPPVILGHEIAGEICETGKNVTHLKAGDRVTVNPAVFCNECEQCKQGLTNLCENKIVPGTPKWIGCFVEYFPAPASIVYKINDSVSYSMATLVEPLAVAVRVLRQIRSKNNKSIAILGRGSIGLLVQFLAKQEGYTKFFCSDPVPFNRESAAALGAETIIDPLSENIVDKVLENTNGQGVDACVVAAGAPNILDQASYITKNGGEIVLVAMISKPIMVDSYSFVRKEQTLAGSMIYTPDDFEYALNLVNSGVDLSQFITHELPIEKVQDAMDMLSEKKENVIKIILKINEGENNENKEN